MEYLNGFNTLKAVKMLVLSNISRASHPQKPFSPIDVSETKKQRRHSFREKQCSKLNSIKVNSDSNNVEKTRKEKLLHSNSVDAIITHKDGIETKVMRSAKGLLETNLDDLFNDAQNLNWSNTDIPNNAKTLGASEPILSVTALGDCVNFNGDLAKGDYDSDDDDDETTDSDNLDEVVREQKKCLGASRFGKILRRVISRNGKRFLSAIQF